MSKNLNNNLFRSREIKVGDLTIGGENPVLIQTMTNTSLENITSTVNQIERIINHGCHLVRVAVPTLNDTENLLTVKKELKKRSIKTPLIADIHYSPVIAEASARIVEKVRVNPGNFIKEKDKKAFSGKDFSEAKEKIFNNIQPLLNICKQYGTAIRIGVNWGSLSKRILYRYGNTPEGMVESALEFMDILLSSGFENFTLSLKASDVKIMQQANIMLAEKMIGKDTIFPLHLGVTEAGDGNPARVKSATGIGTLLKLGIGDTIRVSLTEAPENEIPVAQKLAKFSNKVRKIDLEEIRNITFTKKEFGENVKKYLNNPRTLIIGKTESTEFDLVFSNGVFKNREIKTEIKETDLEISKIEGNENFEEFLIKSSVEFSYDFLKRGVNSIFLDNSQLTNKDLAELSKEILQALGLRYFKAEYIACPSCGRTRFVIIDKLKSIKEKTSHLKGVKIAIMGCNVNGPGEMADADYGYVGSGKGKVTIYKNGKPVLKNIPEDDATDILVSIIEKDRKQNID